MYIEKNGEDAYFAASNSANGFCSYYKECFDDGRIGHVYAIKGGPGTGKSRFMRDVAAYGERMGWRCEYIYCSSDPNSLDGVILSTKDACIALLDATAPHVYEPTRPGVREDIVNLGQFWDSCKLGNFAEKIESLNRNKSDAYRRAYRYLAGYGEVAQACESLMAPYVSRKRISDFAERLMQDIPYGTKYEICPALIASVGMCGAVRLDTYFREAKQLYLIEDYRGTAQYLMQSLGELAVLRRLRVRLSHDPILSHRIDGIFLCESQTAFVVAPREECAYPYRSVRMRRFVDFVAMQGDRRRIAYAERLCKAMLGGAIDAMRQVSEAHFELEEIYMQAMDFAAKEEYTRDFCKQLFDLKKE